MNLVLDKSFNDTTLSSYLDTAFYSRAFTGRCYLTKLRTSKDEQGFTESLRPGQENNNKIDKGAFNHPVCGTKQITQLPFVRAVYHFVYIISYKLGDE